MPELPEVETTMRGLEAAILGRKIISAQMRRHDLRFPVPKSIAAGLRGRTITQFARRAKYIIATLDDDMALLIHLGMSGRMVVGAAATPEKHDHLIMMLEGNIMVRFNDPRRFGSIDYLPAENMPHHKLLRALGVEALDQGLNAKYLAQKLKGRSSSIKAALLDQRIIAGLGNIYVCEALYYAGIAPERAAGSLTEKEIAALVPAIKKVLKAAIMAGGSSLRDYVQSDGALGYFQHQFAVYDREGEPCKNCDCNGKATVQRITQSGRSSFYCAVRQG